MNVLVLCHLDPEALAALNDRHTCTVITHVNSEEADRHVADAEVVVLRSPARLDRHRLQMASRLKLVVRAGMGLEGIDLPCAREMSIPVILVPVSAESVAEHVMGLILCLTRHIPSLDRSLRAGRWEKHSRLGCELRGRTLGLLGFGRIGIQTAELARAFGMSLLANDRTPDKPWKREAAVRLGLRFVGLNQLFSQSDVVSIQTPLNSGTRGLVDRYLLQTMKPGAFVVNVGRGEVVDEVALADLLGSGHLGGAALDVFAQEPPGQRPLLQLESFVGTPHVAAQTTEAQRHIGRVVVDVIDAFAAGRSPVVPGALLAEQDNSTDEGT